MIRVRRLRRGGNVDPSGLVPLVNVVGRLLQRPTHSLFPFPLRLPPRGTGAARGEPKREEEKGGLAAG